MMNAIAKTLAIVPLRDIYPPFREKMEEYARLAESDIATAEIVFHEAQAIAKAFWAGSEYGRGGT